MYSTFGKIKHGSQKADKSEEGNIANAAKTAQQDASKNTKTSVIKDTLRETVQYFTEKCTVDKKDNKYNKYFENHWSWMHLGLSGKQNFGTCQYLMKQMNYAH